MTLEQAHAEMKRLGWGFARNKATGNYVVGPYDGYFVQWMGSDTDFVAAMEKGIQRFKERGGKPFCNVIETASPQTDIKTDIKS